jgi:predicted transcriptional regulator
MVKPTEVQLSPDTQARLARIADERGSEPQALARQIERFVEYDEWFVGEVDKGIAAANQDLIEHEEAGRRSERRFPS